MIAIARSKKLEAQGSAKGLGGHSLSSSPGLSAQVQAPMLSGGCINFSLCIQLPHELHLSLSFPNEDHTEISSLECIYQLLTTNQGRQALWRLGILAADNPSHLCRNIIAFSSCTTDSFSDCWLYSCPIHNATIST